MLKVLTRTKISGQTLVMGDGLEFNPLASRLLPLWEGVQAMGGDLTRAGEKFDQAHLLEGWGINVFQ